VQTIFTPITSTGFNPDQRHVCRFAGGGNGHPFLTTGKPAGVNQRTLEVREMAKRHADPVLERLLHAVEQTSAATVPVAVSVRGTQLRGELISQEAYFAQLASGGALLGALGAEAVGGSDGKDLDKSSGGYAHLRGESSGVWRIALNAVDAWTLLADDAGRDHDERGGASALGSIFGRDAER